MADEYRRMRQLTGTPAEWASSGLIIGDAEIAVERTGNKSRIKLGDGFSTFIQLPYLDVGNAGGGNVTLNYLARGDGAGGLVNSAISDDDTNVTVHSSLVVDNNANIEGTLTVDGTAAFASPITIPTAAPGTNNTTAANTAFVNAAIIANNEDFVIKTGDVMTGRLTINSGGLVINDGGIEVQFGGLKVTGNSQFISPVTGPTAAPGTSNTQLATTAFVQNAVGGGGVYVRKDGDTMTGPLVVNHLDGITTQKLTVDDVVISGIATAPTQPLGTDDDTLATTAFVLANAGAGFPEAPIDGQIYGRRGSDTSWQLVAQDTVNAQHKEFTATAGQTQFNFDDKYAVGFVSVFVNGVRLSLSEFTATGGTLVTLVNPVLAGDTVLLDGFTGADLTGVPEAPVDGKQYARKDAAWAEVTVPAGLPEAPTTGDIYARRGSDQTWQLIPTPTELGLSDGFASAPSLFFESDALTGMYYHAPGMLGFSASGNGGLIFTQEGRLGVGVEPGTNDAQLEVGGDLGNGMIRANVGGPTGNGPNDPGLIIRNISTNADMNKKVSILAQGRRATGEEMPNIGEILWYPADTDWMNTSVGINVLNNGQAQRNITSIYSGQTGFGVEPFNCTSSILTGGEVTLLGSTAESVTFNSYYVTGGWRIRNPGFGAAMRMDHGGTLDWFINDAATSGNNQVPANMKRQMRLTRSGELFVPGIIQAKDDGQGGVVLANGGTGNAGYVRFLMPDNSSSGYIGFASWVPNAHINYNNENGTGGHSFGQACYAPAFNPTSDERLKTNIKPATEDSGTIIDAIEIVCFDWIADGKHQSFGIVAQDLYNAYPESVTPAQNEDDIWSYDPAKLLMLAIKEIQSLRARVAELEARP